MGKANPPSKKSAAKLNIDPSSVTKATVGTLSKSKSGLGNLAAGAVSPSKKETKARRGSMPDVQGGRRKSQEGVESPMSMSGDESRPMSPMSAASSRPMSPASVEVPDWAEEPMSKKEHDKVEKAQKEEDKRAAREEEALEKERAAAAKRNSVSGGNYAPPQKEAEAARNAKARKSIVDQAADDVSVDSDDERTAMKKQKDDLAKKSGMMAKQGEETAKKASKLGRKVMGMNETAGESIEADLQADERSPCAWRHNRAANTSFAPLGGAVNKISGLSPAMRFLNDPEIHAALQDRNFTLVLFHPRFHQLIDELSGGPGKKKWNAWNAGGDYWAIGKLIKHIEGVYEMPNAKTKSLLDEMNWRELNKISGFSKSLSAMREPEKEKAIRCLTGNIAYYSMFAIKGASQVMSYEKKKRVTDTNKVEEESGLVGKTVGRSLRKGSEKEKEMGDKAKMIGFLKDVVADAMVERSSNPEDMQRQLLANNFRDLLVANCPFVELLTRFVDRYPVASEGGPWSNVVATIGNQEWAELMDNEEFMATLKKVVGMFKAKQKMSKLGGGLGKSLKKAAKAADVLDTGVGDLGGPDAQAESAELCWQSGRDREGRMVVVIDLMQLPVYEDSELVEEAVDKCNALLDNCVDGNFVCVAVYDSQLANASETTVTNVFNAVQSIYKYMGRRYMTLLSVLYIVHPKKEYGPMDGMKFKAAAKKLAQTCETFAQKAEQIWCVLDLYEAIRHEQVNLPSYCYLREYEKKVEVRISVRELRQLKTSMTKALNEKRKIAEEIMGKGSKLSSEHRAEVQRYLTVDPAFENRYKKFKARLPPKEEADNFVLCDSGEIVFLLRSLSLEMHNRERLRIIESTYGGKKGRGSVADAPEPKRSIVGNTRASITGSSSKDPNSMSNAEAAAAATAAVAGTKGLGGKFGLKKRSSVA